MAVTHEKAPSVSPGVLDQLKRFTHAADLATNRAAIEIHGQLHDVFEILTREIATNASRPKSALPAWIRQVDDNSIMVYPGSPLEPALLLRKDGSLNPTESILGYQPPNGEPLQGMAYILTVRSLFPFLSTRLQPKESNNKSQEVLE